MSKKSFPPKDNFRFGPHGNLKILGPHEIREVPEDLIVQLEDKGRPQYVPMSGGSTFGSGSHIQCPNCKKEFWHYPRTPKDLIYHCIPCNHWFNIYGDAVSLERIAEIANSLDGMSFTFPTVESDA